MSPLQERQGPFLVLLRHARALPALPGQEDSTRRLSPEELAEFEAKIRRLAATGFACDAILTSPWIRAQQTAAILAQTCEGAPLVHEGLCHAPSTAAGRVLLEQAAQLARQQRLVLVGHDPWIGELAGLLGVGPVGAVECGELLWLESDSTGGWALRRRL